MTGDRAALPNRRRGRRATVGSAAVASTVAAGAALAFWVGGGAGSGSASTEVLSQLTLSPATPVAQLYPGGSSDVVLTITNSNRATVRIGTLSLDEDLGTAGLSVDADHPACPPSALAFTPADGGSGWTVPGAVAGVPGSITATLPDALSMSLDADDHCQGAVVTVYLSVGP